MAAYLRSTHVNDSLLCALALLLVASVVRSLEDRSPVGAVAIVTGALIVLLKVPYLPIALIALLPGGRAEWRRRALAALVIGSAAFVSIALWRAGQPLAQGAIPAGTSRLAEIVASPVELVRLLVNDLVTNAWAYRMSFIGILGRLDAPIGPNLRLVLGLILTLLILLESQGVESTRGTRLCALALLVASVAAIQLLMYVTWTLPDHPGIEGVQGRYFLPIVPAALLALPRLVDISPRITRFAGIVFVPFSLAVTIAINTLRYWDSRRRRYLTPSAIRAEGPGRTCAPARPVVGKASGLARFAQLAQVAPRCEGRRPSLQSLGIG